MSNHLGFRRTSTTLTISRVEGNVDSKRKMRGRRIGISWKGRNTCSVENCPLIRATIPSTLTDLQKATNTCVRMCVCTYKQRCVYIREQTKGKCVRVCVPSFCCTCTRTFIFLFVHTYDQLFVRAHVQCNRIQSDSNLACSMSAQSCPKPSSFLQRCSQSIRTIFSATPVRLG